MNTLLEFIDLKNPAHLEAFEIASHTGEWPKDFLPNNITRTPRDIEIIARQAALIFKQQADSYKQQADYWRKGATLH